MGIASSDADADPWMGGEGGLDQTGGMTGGDADEGRDGSVYLVAPHYWSMVSRPYAVYKVEVATPGASSPSSARLKEVTRLKCVAAGKTLTSVQSTHDAWIVGAGGATGDTVIFDTKTRKVIRGPYLKSPKWCPVLVAVGYKVYAFSRGPSWKGKPDPDFPPWFEVLDLKGAKVVDDLKLEGCSWRELAIPPCLPWKLTPMEYTMLPITILRSHVVVDSYILLSFNQPWGTYAFDTNSDKWHKVDSEELPFVGCATPLGGYIFLGLSHKGAINAYCINFIKTTSDKEEDHSDLKLSITVLPVKYEGQRTGF